MFSVQQMVDENGEEYDEQYYNWEYDSWLRINEIEEPDHDKLIITNGGKNFQKIGETFGVMERI